ncbi:MAG: ABC transporter ATP-binding protein [Planctomycetota bacterium]
MKNSTPLCRVSGLTKSFHDGEQELSILKGVDLEVNAGESLAILGRSGSGKSTLLHIMGLMDSPNSGSLSLSGQELTQLSDRKKNRLRSQQIGFVFQHFHLLPEFSILDNVILPARIAGLGIAQARERALHLLDEVGLADRTKHRPRKLSGGEQQRAAIARALINRPTLLLCDEPTGNLDTHTSSTVFTSLLSAAALSESALVMVTHDQSLAKETDRQLLLTEGRVCPTE